MLNQFQDFLVFISNPTNFSTISNKNKNLVKVVNNFKILNFSGDIINENEIKSRIKESKVVVIDYYEEANSEKLMRNHSYNKT